MIKKFCFKNYSDATISARGSVGGITTLWNNSLFELTDSAATRYMLTMVLKIIGSIDILCMTNVYAPHKVAEKIDMLKILSRIQISLNRPYKIIAGDFNMVSI